MVPPFWTPSYFHQPQYMLPPQFAYPQLYPTQLPYTPNPVPSSSTSHAASQAYLTSTAQSPSQSRYPDSGASLRVTNMSQNIQQLTHFEGPDQITICNGQGLNVNSSGVSTFPSPLKPNLSLVLSNMLLFPQLLKI